MLTTKLSWANVNFDDPVELEAMRAQDADNATRRAKSAVAELKRLGILDNNGRRVRQELPADMRPDSSCDMSRL